MTAVAYKESSVSSYPISNAARERIDSARQNDVGFDIRRVLRAGGFNQHEANVIADIVLAHIIRNNRIEQVSLAADLHARGFAKVEANEIAKAIAR